MIEKEIIFHSLKPTGSFKNLVGKKLRLECDINLKPLKNLWTQDFNKVIG
jgi:riboflavin synthase alpha subunit